MNLRTSSILLSLGVIGCAAAKAPATNDAPPSPSRCHVFGRIVDVSGAPLADVHVNFHVATPWAPAAAATEFSVGGQDGIEITTNAAGRFEFDAPVPTTPSIFMLIEPDRFHLQAQRRFGVDGDAMTPSLFEGDNDLGELVLDSAGVVSGAVVDANGIALADVEVSLDNAFPNGLSVNVRSDAAGRFELAHAPAGSWGLVAQRAGFLQSHTNQFDIALGSVVSSTPIVLQRAPTIAGVVVDDAGAPIPNASIVGFAEQGGSSRMANATSAADGTFKLDLYHVVPHRLEVKAMQFAPHRHHDSEPFAVGAADVRIVLPRLALATFRVLDAVTDAPIEDFRLLFDDSEVGEWQGGDWATYHFPNGTAQWGAEPGTSFFRVHAPGYAPLAGPVLFNGAEPRTQVIRMLHATSITGRVKTATGGPPPSAIVQLDGGPRTVSVTTERDGSFRFTDLTPGEYELSATVPGDSYHAPIHVVAKQGGIVDVGVLVLAPGMTLRGRALTFDKAPVVARTVHLRARGVFDEREERSAADGSFAFEGLAPGKYDVSTVSDFKIRANSLMSGNWSTSANDIDMGASASVEIESGVDAEVTLIEPKPVHRVKLHVRATVNGVPDPTVRVNHHLPIEGRGVAVSKLPPPDAEGRIDCDVDVNGESWLELLAGNEALLKRQSLGDAIGDDLSMAIDAVASRIVVDMPEGVTIADGDSVYAHVQYSDRSEARPDAGIHFGRGGARFGQQRMDSIPFTDRHYELGSVPPGKCVLTISGAIGTWKKRIEVAPGATTTVAFTLDDMQMVGGYEGW